MAKTVLLADDSVAIQKLAGLSFASEDMILVTTDNGDDAMARTRELEPDVVVLDVVMPGMSGYRVCEWIKQNPRLKDTAVLLLASTVDAFDVTAAERAGADGHITKPFEAQVLVDRVKALISASDSGPGNPVAPEEEASSNFAPPSELLDLESVSQTPLWKDPNEQAADFSKVGLGNLAEDEIFSALRDTLEEIPVGTPEVPDPDFPHVGDPSSPFSQRSQLADPTANLLAETGEGTRISPKTEARIREILEHVAWDALSDLPEQIVKTLVDRIEAVAWEVIPQLAETLIKEEIERIRDEDT